MQDTLTQSDEMLITCNDVIVHVGDQLEMADKMARMLTREGWAVSPDDVASPHAERAWLKRRHSSRRR